MNWNIISPLLLAVVLTAVIIAGVYVLVHKVDDVMKEYRQDDEQQMRLINISATA